MLVIHREEYNGENRLKPCYMCDRYHTIIVDSDYINKSYDKEEEKYPRDRYFVSCLDCNYRTNGYKSIEKAIDAWNEPPIIRNKHYKESLCPFCHKRQHIGIAYFDQLGNFIGTTKDPHEDCLYKFLEDPLYFDKDFFQYTVRRKSSRRELCNFQIT